MVYSLSNFLPVLSARGEDVLKESEVRENPKFLPWSLNNLETLLHWSLERRTEGSSVGGGDRGDCRETVSRKSGCNRAEDLSWRQRETERKRSWKMKRNLPVLEELFHCPLWTAAASEGNCASKWSEGSNVCINEAKINLTWLILICLSSSRGCVGIN